MNLAFGSLMVPSTFARMQEMINLNCICIIQVNKKFNDTMREMLNRKFPLEY